MNKRYTLSEVRNIVNNRGFELLEKEYKNPRTKMAMKDSKGYKYSLSLEGLKLSKTPYKFVKYNPYTIENIELWLEQNLNGYKILSDEYKDTHSKLCFQCNEGHIFYMAFADLQYGQRCPKCKGIKNAQRSKHTTKYVSEYIKKTGYFLLTKQYKNMDQKLKIKCPKGHVFEMDFQHFKRGQRCVFCDGSSGEIEIQNYLDKNNIHYEREFKFDDLKDKGFLRFDFAIFKDDQLVCLIEFDGEQHYKIKNFGGISHEKALKKFNETQKRDNLKDKYCKEKNISLTRIHYTQFNDIKKILDMVIPR
ncbi:hypothetical protein P3F01_15505 [Clostridium perfringens]|uniref:hypothetical protein n=1 Tax=Clostridium perfringens TaxID=1502 RepID=UPI0028E13577|nr:hypothetical protein [Clostridium perfringens]MDT9337765.1 hypothetical protein [Clostridium perfringens]MDT9345522.1 hypothetical protein [Clostridium perfringens]MDT9348765.1 hypothetical protein [Clostridium perfringens]MDT9354633.1 hypothetical protein [Clostridium perfringens]